jgi:hypothetical protein
VAVEASGDTAGGGVKELAERLLGLTEGSERLIEGAEKGVQGDRRVESVTKTLPVAGELTRLLLKAEAIEQKANRADRDPGVKAVGNVVLAVLKPHEEEVGALNLALAQRFDL